MPYSLPKMRPPGHMVSGLIKLIDDVKKFSGKEKLTVVEVGSFAGESAEIFAVQGCLVYCVDPYESDYDVKDPISECSIMEAAEKELDKIAATFLGSVIKIRKTSAEASRDFAPGSVDLVYIDGNHQHEAVMEDIKNWRGIPKYAIAGHDYSDSLSTVKKAVNKNFKPDKIYVDSSWLVFKEK